MAHSLITRSNKRNTVTYETLYEKELQERLARPQNWREMCKVTMSNTRVITSQSISTTGDWAATAALTRGTAFDPTDVAEVADTLTISTARQVTTYFDFADLAQSPWTSEREIYSRAGQRLGEYIESDVLAQHASWRNLGGSAGAWADNSATPLAGSAANIDDLARLIRRVIREQNGESLMARNGIGAVLSPASFEFVEALDRRGLLKPSLIKAKVQQWITHTKQAIALQVKRLSEREPNFGYATV